MKRLSDLIAPAYHAVYRLIKENKFTEYWFAGGRGSLKSSFVSLVIVIGIMKDPNANAAILMKIGNNIRKAVFEQMLWAIKMLGVQEYWREMVSPLELTYIPTGQKVIFKGCDNPKKIKGVKLSTGYFKYMWFEEVDEFYSMEEIRTVLQTFLRGGENFSVFFTYNPPKSIKNWVNLEILTPKDTRYIHHSTYLDAPKEWLGEIFIAEAEHLKKVNEKAYNHEYLGEVTGTGGEIFDNVTVREITAEEIKAFDNIRHGADWGYAIDPFHYTKLYYDKTRKKIYIFDEIHEIGLSNTRAAELIKERGYNGDIVTCDSAEPKSIDDFFSMGIRAVKAHKGAGSIEHGMKWLGELEEIVIDPARCPNTAREFLNYELEADAYGGFKSKYPDKDNHSIDAVRYALEGDMRAYTGGAVKVRN